MYDHDIRWWALAPLTLVLGFFVLLAETTGMWGEWPCRPEWFWCLAFLAALRSPPVASVFAFGWCGLSRDFLLGPKPGVAMLAFVIVGWMIHFWKPIAVVRGLPGQVFIAGVGAFAVSLLKHSLDYGSATYKLWDWVLLLSFGDALMTGVAYVPAALILGLPSFRPWRERSGYYFS